jgi:hypothetical protein
MNGEQKVSQAAEFFRIRREEEKARFDEHRNFRRGMAALAAVGAAKALFSRRGS